MSTNHNDSKLDVELDRHIAAMRGDDGGSDAGPSLDLIAKTQAMIRELEAVQAHKHDQQQRRRLSISQRLVAMTATQRIAAVVLITLGALTLYVLFGLFNSLAPSVALADVASTFKAAHTFVFRSTVQVPGSPAVSMKMLVADPDRVRTELAGGTTVMILKGKTSLVLNTLQHTAKRIELTGDVEKPHPNPENGASFVEAMRSLTGAKGTPAGEKNIDGVACVGFKTTYHDWPMTVWAEKKSSKAVQAEITFPMGGQAVTMVMDQFQLDPPLDESLFSLEAPAGYTTETQSLPMPKLSELGQDVAGVLEEYAKASGGEFPKSLTDWATYFKVTGVKNLSSTNPAEDKAFTAKMTHIGTISGMLFAVPGGYGYAGQDARLGEKDKIVFWYRLAKDSPTYRAVYADLHIADVPGDQIPAPAATRPTR